MSDIAEVKEGRFSEWRNEVKDYTQVFNSGGSSTKIPGILTLSAQRGTTLFWWIDK